MSEKILMIFTNYSSFVKQDYEILSEKYKVFKYKFDVSEGKLTFIWEFIKQFFFLLLKGYQYKAFYIWFADYHSFLPVIYSRLTGKKSFLVIGGYDVNRMPAYKYGAYVKKYRGFFTITSIRNSTLNLPVSSYVARKLKYIAPKTKNELVYNSVAFKPAKSQDLSKEDLIVTVGIIDSNRSYMIKGIDTFIQVAKELNNYNFLIIGVLPEMKDHLLKQIPKNVILKNKVDHNQLVRYYQKAKIYLQLSRMDTFSLSLAESMLFNCTPIISNVGGMPEVAGQFGVIVPRDIKVITETIEDKIHSPVNENTSNYIQENFGLNARKQKLFKLISLHLT